MRKNVSTFFLSSHPPHPHIYTHPHPTHLITLTIPQHHQLSSTISTHYLPPITPTVRPTFLPPPILSPQPTHSPQRNPQPLHNILQPPPSLTLPQALYITPTHTHEVQSLYCIPINSLSFLFFFLSLSFYFFQSPYPFSNLQTHPVICQSLPPSSHFSSVSVQSPLSAFSDPASPASVSPNALPWWRETHSILPHFLHDWWQGSVCRRRRRRRREKKKWYEVRVEWYGERGRKKVWHRYM